MFGGKKKPQSAEQHIDEMLKEEEAKKRYADASKRVQDLYNGFGGGWHSSTTKLEIPPLQQLVGALTACRVPFEHIDGQIIFTTDQGTCHLDILANEDDGTTDIWFEESVTDEED